MFVDKEIRKAIEGELDKGNKSFAIFPFGEVGVKTKEILNKQYNIKETLLIDNHLCKYNPNVNPIDVLDKYRDSGIKVILTSTSWHIYNELKGLLLQHVSADDIVEMTSMMSAKPTKVGKHTTGIFVTTPQPLIESIGAFCNFAKGVAVVGNHPYDMLSIHQFMYMNAEINPTQEESFWEMRDQPYYIEGIVPRAKLKGAKRITIGSDVWFGQNVIITNYSNIGNGVIAAAGAVITKDVPDYAIVAGVPARIMRYRYTQPQIEALNKICWWDWEDSVIAERYDDFYLSIEDFIEKYRVD